jgi:hypothetical protein
MERAAGVEIRGRGAVPRGFRAVRAVVAPAAIDVGGAMQEKVRGGQY